MEPIRDGLICWLESADLNLNSTIWRDRTGNVEAELINFDSDFKQDGYLITKRNENYVKVYDNFNFLNKTITIALKKGDISNNSGIFGYWQGKNFFITGYPSQEKWGFIPNGEAINIVSVDRPLDYVVLTVTISSKGKVCIYHDSKKMIESEENTITITNPLHFFKKHDAPANGTDAKTGMILVYDRVLTEEEIVHNSTYEKLKNKAYINSNNLPKLVEKLTDASNIKISNNKYGNRVQTVIDKIVDKADNITKAINQEVINDSHTFKVGTGNNVNVSSDVQDSFSPISLKGNTYQNLIQNDNNNEVIPNEIITTEKDTIQTFKVNDGEINLKIEGQTYQNLSNNIQYKGSGNWVHVYNISENGTYTFKSDDKNAYITLYDKEAIKLLRENSVYTLVFDIDTDFVNYKGICINGNVDGYFDQSTNIYLRDTNTTLTNGSYKFKFTMGSVTNMFAIGFRKSNTITGGTYFRAYNFKLLKGDYTNTDLPTSINGIESVAERESKNLLENVKWHDGMINNENGLHLDSDVAMYSDLIDIDINTLYHTNLIDNNGNSYRCRLYKADGSYLGRGLTATSTKDMYDRRANLEGLAKIRLLILNKTVTPLPSNPILLPNLYTHDDVNVKGTDSWRLVRKSVAVKPNTQYKISLEIESISKGSNNFSPIVEFYSNEKNDRTFLKRVYNSGSFDLTTKEDTTILVIVFVVNNATVSTTICEANFKNICISESSYLYSVRLTNRSKNLLDISTFKPISYPTIQTSKDENVITVTGLRTSDVEAYTDAKACNLKVYLEENKTYSFSFKSDGEFGGTAGTDTVEIFFMLEGKTQNYFNVLGQRTVIIPKGFSGYYYLRLDVNSGDKTHKFWDIQVEEGSVVTDYEPYLNTTTEIPLPQPLRSLPNGVCDEVVGNKLIQRIGKIIPTSTNVAWSNSLYNINKDGVSTYVAHGSFNSVKYCVGANINLICDKIPVGGLNAEALNYNIMVYNHSTTSKELRIAVPKTLLLNATIGEFKEWLDGNPVTLYYELATPIEHELNIPQMFEKYSTNIITTSNNIKPNFNIESKGYEYKALIKPSTQYTLMLNAKDGSDNLDFVLGGTKITVPKTNSRNLIQTPNTLTDSNLYIGGLDTTVNNIMLLEGDLREDENIPSYFKGIAGVGEKSKNLFKKLFANEIAKCSIAKVFDNGEFMLNGTISLHYMFYVTIPKGTYSTNVVQELGTTLHVFWKGGDSGFYNKDAITYDSDTELQCYIAKGTYNNILCKYQIEQSITKTKYEPSYDGHKIEILSTGKNLVDLKNMPLGGLSNLGELGINSNASYKVTPNFIKIDSKNKLYFHYEYDKNDTSTPAHNMIACYDKNFSYIGALYDRQPNGVFINLPSKACYIRLRVRKETVRLSLIAEPVEIYEPYKEDKTQILLDEPLMRLPNGVCDEITRDGKLIRRVGKVVLDGSENWVINIQLSRENGHIAFRHKPNNFLLEPKWIRTISDRFCGTVDNALINNMASEFITGHGWGFGLNISINKEKLSVPNEIGFKEWLHLNPVTAYYELATPVVSDIIPPSLRMFKDGHLTFNTLVAPESTHLVQLNKSAQIERSIREVQSLDGRVEKLESFYDDMILENSHKLQLLDMDFNYVRNMEDI